MKNYQTPWQVKPGRVSHTVHDRDGQPICTLPPFEWSRAIDLDAQRRCAQLMAMAPELLHHLATLLDVMRRADREFTASQDLPLTTDDEWTAALDDAGSLIDLLADEGIVAGSIQ
jgi:hypothetical protein